METLGARVMRKTLDRVEESLNASAGWYYLLDDGERFGPVATAELRRLLQSGGLPLEVLVWNDGMAEWASAKDIPALRPDPYASKAVWSLILGLVSVFGLFPPVMLLAGIGGLVTGLAARQSISRRGSAIAGICLSVLGLALVAVLAWMFFDALQHVGWQGVLGVLED